MFKKNTNNLTTTMRTIKEHICNLSANVRKSFGTTYSSLILRISVEKPLHTHTHTQCKQKRFLKDVFRKITT